MRLANHQFDFYKKLSYKNKLAIAFGVPIILFYMAIGTLLYTQARSEIEQEIDENGKIILMTLSQGSEYGLISGNIRDIEQSVQWLRGSNRNLRGVEIYNQHHTLLLAVGDNTTNKNTKQLNGVINRYSVAIANENPTDPIELSLQSTSPDPILGYIKITLTNEFLMTKKWRSLGNALLYSLIVLFLTIVALSKFTSSLSRSMSELLSYIKTIKNGQYDAPQFIPKSEEMGLLFSAFKSMAESLQKAEMIKEDKLTQRSLALEKSNAEKKELIRRLNDVAEEERRAIAVDIHDQLNSQLIMIKLDAHNIQSELNSLPPTDEAQHILNASNYIIQRVSLIHEETRTIVSSLRPEMLDILGLRDAIEELVNNYSNSSCKFYYDGQGEFTDLDPKLALACYRLIQESISNVLKHAMAKHCHIELKLMADSNHIFNTIHIQVEDDGIGFDVSANAKGIGLIGMRERVETFDGTLNFISAPDRGTTLTFFLPYLAKAPESPSS